MSERDRGQTELVGFALIFGIVVLAIALVGATGFVGLDNVKDYQRTTNAEQAFSALADDVDDVANHGAPSRETEVGLADATLSLGEPAEIAVTVGNESPENTTVVETRPIVYDSGSGTTIVYTSGALVRQDGESAVMYRRPDFVLTDETVVLPLVATSPAGDGPVGGSATVQVRSRGAGSEIPVARDDASDVTVEVTTSRVDPWRRYLDGEPAVDCAEPANETVVCDVDTERVYVTVDHVDVGFR